MTCGATELRSVRVRLIAGANDAGRAREVEVDAASQIWSARCENEYEGTPVLDAGSVEPGTAAVRVGLTG